MKEVKNMECFENINWEFLFGDVIIPIGLFLIGFVTGKTVEKRAKAKIKGNNNNVIQNSKRQK